MSDNLLSTATATATTTTNMRVLKRDNTLEDISFDKVLRRIRKLCDEGVVLTGVRADEIAQKVCSRIYDGVKTSELDELAAQMCASLVTTHPDYGTLASRIAVSNHHKNTSPSFSETMALLHRAKDVGGMPNPLISDELWEVVKAHKEKLNSVIDYTRDYDLDYFGFKTLERAYLMRIDGKTVERPQHMWMRVALGIHSWDIKEALDTYDLMSLRFFTHATPTLFNAGTPRAQMASCYLLGSEDSVGGMYKTIADCAQISKYAGGIGVHVHDIRAKGSHIRGTNGTSSGIIPMLRVYNNVARHINQAGKRLGSIAIYLEPWHADVEAFLDIRKNSGSEEDRCRDLFSAMWIPDLFMRRVQENGDWCLMCPDECPGLSEAVGDAFEELYTKYEAEGKYRKQVKAQAIWMGILKSQIETGTPYLCYKDAANTKSNQKNLGTIKSSNLCSEIIEYSDDTSYAVCNLASIALPAFVRPNGTFDFDKLHCISQTITRNLNKVIDRTFYPVPETKTSNLKHRPIGLGVQGLADVYALMRCAFDSPEAAALNREIFETIYHGAVTASVAIARRRAELMDELAALEKVTGVQNDGTREAALLTHLRLIPEESAILRSLEGNVRQYRGAYSSFIGSPAWHGLLQFDLWDRKPESDVAGTRASGRWDWAALKAELKAYGMRNSLLLAPMPTASTSQILGNTECFEPITSNIFQRQTLAGEFTIINKHLVKDLLALGLWNVDMKNRILSGGGSVQHIDEIPNDIKVLYKTAWELKQKVLIDQAADRGIYVCQSQSLNLFVEDAEFTKLNAMHFYAWKSGLKTGCYYLRTRPKAKMSAYSLSPASSVPQAIGLVTKNKNDTTKLQGGAESEQKSLDLAAQEQEEAVLACRRDNPEGCLMCSG